MDFSQLPANHLAAGREYLGRLQELGLRPEGLFWVRAELAFDPEAETDVMSPWIVSPEWRLLLATSVYDEAGPLNMQQLLFRAYNASLTPKSISPFVLQLISPKTTIYKALLFALTTVSSPMIWSEGQPVETAAGVPETKVGEFTVSRAWTYIADSSYASYSHRVGQLRKFRANIEKLAA